MYLTKFKKLITTTLLATMACFCLTIATSSIDTIELNDNYSIMPLEDGPIYTTPTEGNYLK